MSIKEKIISDISCIENPILLEFISGILDELKDKDNKKEVLNFGDTISDDTAQEISIIIESEFNNIEGDWA